VYLNFEVYFVSLVVWQSGCMGGKRKPCDRGGWQQRAHWIIFVFMILFLGLRRKSSQPAHLLIIVAGWPCWHYIQVDCEVTAIETAILGVLPGSVLFLTIPCVSLPWLP